MNFKKKEWLIKHYVKMKLSCPAIAKLTEPSVTGNAISYWLKKHKIPIRAIGWSRLDKPISLATRIKIASSLKGHKRTKDSIAKQIKTCITNKVYENRKPVHPKRYWFICKDKTIKCMRSSWEVAFAEWLTENNYTWQYESQTFPLSNSTYTPDFYVKEVNTYFEIKGWLRKDAKEKINLFKKLYPNHNLIILYKEHLIAIGCDISKRANMDRPTKICSKCNSSFTPKRSKQIFCNLKCANGRQKTQNWKKNLSISKSKPIKCVETKKVFDSVSIAAKEYNVSVQSIYQAVVRNGRCCGFHWERTND
jgi:hypothetical protein